MTESDYRLGIDIGGTFTDVVLLGDDGTLYAKKVLSTPEDYSTGVIEGARALLQDVGIPAGAVRGIVHATTVASNAVLEGKGARTALMTTYGFRDVLEMRRLRIPVLYDLQYDKPAPLVPRRARFEIHERLGPGGEVWEPLDEADVSRVAEHLRSQEYEALAICFLHSYANARHERRAAELVRAIVGEELYITCSADILPEVREYERTSTAVVNAYVGPPLRRYLQALEARLHGLGLTAPLQIMQSSGGVMSAAAAASKPAHLVESGPAAGVVACAYLARSTTNANLISLDMGGTTAKAAMLENGEPVRTTEYEVGAGINLSSRLVKGGGYPIRLPFIDLSEIGAGGGSIVQVDSFGLLKVGPESAGADPGPVCYGRGGVLPTLTDALTILGFLNPECLAGGGLRLESQEARRVFEEDVAVPLGMSVLDAAYGVYMLAVATMTRAVKAVSTYRGRDPRDFVLCGFGGNGPVAAVAIARALQMRRVLIPPAPGVFSATGLLLSEIEYEFGRALFLRGAEATGESLAAAYSSLEREAVTAMATEGYKSSALLLKRLADVRYSGQAYELTVPVAGGVPDVQDIVGDFNDEHLKTYGHSASEDPVDFVNVKVLARVKSASGAYKGSRSWEANGTKKQSRMVYFGPAFGVVRAPVIDRAALKAESRYGPLIVEEYDSTCVVAPGCHASVDESWNIDISVEDV